MRYALTHDNVTVRAFKCDLCSYKAKSKDRLNQHKLVHSDEREFKCNFCSYEAKFKGNLKRHALTHVNV